MNLDYDSTFFSFNLNTSVSHFQPQTNYCFKSNTITNEVKHTTPYTVTSKVTSIVVKTTLKLKRGKQTMACGVYFNCL